MRAILSQLTNFHLKVIDYFLSLPNQKDLEKHKLSESQWMVLQDFESILQVRVTLCANTRSTL